MLYEENVPVNMERLRLGQGYDRAEIAYYILGLRGFDSLHGIARGVVTPENDNKIFLFIRKKGYTPSNAFTGDFDGQELETEGFDGEELEIKDLDNRIISSKESKDDVYLFYSNEGVNHFIYYGSAELISYEISSGKPTKFKFRTK